MSALTRCSFTCTHTPISPSSKPCPPLQCNRPAANAALLLGLLWEGWHLPTFFYRDTYTEMGLLGFPLFVVSIVFASIVFTWLYNSTAGSLMLVILFHVFFNWLSVSEDGGKFVGFLMIAPVDSVGYLRGQALPTRECITPSETGRVKYLSYLLDKLKLTTEAFVCR